MHWLQQLLWQTMKICAAKCFFATHDTCSWLPHPPGSHCEACVNGHSGSVIAVVAIWAGSPPAASPQQHPVYSLSRVLLRPAVCCCVLLCPVMSCCVLPPSRAGPPSLSCQPLVVDMARLLRPPACPPPNAQEVLALWSSLPVQVRGRLVAVCVLCKGAAVVCGCLPVLLWERYLLQVFDAACMHSRPL